MLAQQRIQGNVYAAEEPGQEQSIDRFRAGRQQGCHAIALLHTQGLQASRQRLHLGKDLAAGQTLVLIDDEVTAGPEAQRQAYQVLWVEPAYQPLDDHGPSNRGNPA